MSKRTRRRKPLARSPQVRVDPVALASILVGLGEGKTAAPPAAKEEPKAMEEIMQQPQENSRIGTRTGRPVNKLSASQTVKLYNFVEKMYVQSGLGDTEFAEQAAAALGFVITKWNVWNARHEYKILTPDERDREARKAAREAVANKACDFSNVIELVRQLQERVSELEKKVSMQRDMIELIDKRTDPHRQG